MLPTNYWHWAVYTSVPFWEMALAGRNSYVAKIKRQERCCFHRGTAFSTGSLGVCGPPCHQHHIVSSCFIFALKASACEDWQKLACYWSGRSYAFYRTALWAKDMFYMREKMTRSWMFRVSQTVEGFFFFFFSFFFLITDTEQNTVLETFICLKKNFFWRWWLVPGNRETS